MKIQYSKSRNFTPEVVEIYNYSFPDNEKKPIHEISLNLASGKEELIIAKIDSQIVGFAILLFLENSNWILLDYLAVAKSKRGLGIGESILQFLKNDFLVKSTNLLIEVDKPNGVDSVYDQHCNKRIKFYSRANAKIIADFEYVLPSLNYSEKTLQFLMIITFEDKKIIKGSELLTLIQQLYQQNYSGYYHQYDLDLLLGKVNKNQLFKLI